MWNGSISSHELMHTDLSHRHQTSMRGVSKQNLPAKVCLACGRPFTWRKRWERVWDDVKYCSDRCRAKRKTL